MMEIVARQAAHVFPVMLAAAPVKVRAGAGVAIKTPLISFASAQLARVPNIAATTSLGARFSVLVTVLVTLFALGGTRVFQEFCALAMKIERKRIHNGAVALQAVSSDDGLLNCRLNGLRLDRRSSGLEKGDEKARNDGNCQ